MHRNIDAAHSTAQYILHWVEHQLIARQHGWNVSQQLKRISTFLHTARLLHSSIYLFIFLSLSCTQHFTIFSFFSVSLWSTCQCNKYYGKYRKKRVKAWWHLAAFELCFSVDFVLLEKLTITHTHTHCSQISQNHWCFRSSFWLEPFDFHFMGKLFVCKCVCVCLCICCSVCYMK